MLNYTKELLLFTHYTDLICVYVYNNFECLLQKLNIAVNNKYSNSI